MVRGRRLRWARQPVPVLAGFGVLSVLLSLILVATVRSEQTPPVLAVPMLPGVSSDPTVTPPAPDPTGAPTPSASSPAPRNGSASATRTTPTRKVSTPAIKPTVSIVVGAVPSVVSLSSEGTLDWVHWGLVRSTSVDRKRGGSGAIEDRGGHGGRGRYDNNPQVYSWSGGTPVSSVSRTPTGVYTCGEGSSFLLEVAAGTTTRTLYLYAGVWQARGRLDVSVAGASDTARLENRQAIKTARFAITFRAAQETSMAIRWTTEESYNRTCGNVDLQAATLR